jgi:hydrogenase maturation factor
MNEYFCNRDAEGHCTTCSDEALPARILRIDETTGLALVTLNAGVQGPDRHMGMFPDAPSSLPEVSGDAIEEVDITLLESAAVGDEILVHGGVAIAHVKIEGEAR